MKNVNMACLSLLALLLFAGCGDDGGEDICPPTDPACATLDFDGEVTSPIPFNASVSLVQSELEALSNLGGGNVTVSGTSLPGGVLLIDFVGALAGTNVSQLVAELDLAV